MLKPIISRLPVLVALVALLGGTWIEVEAAPLARAGGPGEVVSFSNPSTIPADIDLSAVERVSAAVAMVAIDLDADGDLDIVGIDGALTLLVWENDGSGELTLKEPSESPKWLSDGDDPSLDSPSITEISDQGDTASVRLERRADPVSPTKSRCVSADTPSPLCTRTRVNCTPRAPPVTFGAL